MDRSGRPCRHGAGATAQAWQAPWVSTRMGPAQAADVQGGGAGLVGTRRRLSALALALLMAVLSGANGCSGPLAVDFGRVRHTVRRFGTMVVATISASSGVTVPTGCAGISRTR